jgi:hypothetical protein
MKAFARASFGTTDPITDGGHSVYGDRDVAWHWVNMDEELRKLNDPRAVRCLCCHGKVAAGRLSMIGVLVIGLDV